MIDSLMKSMLVIDGKKSDSYHSFKERIMSLVSDLAVDTQNARVKLVITDEKPSALSLFPFRKNKIAVISIYYRDQLPANLLSISDLRSAYLVTEALPVKYNKEWPDGTPTPGVNLLTLFRKKPEIDYETFIDRWHNGHTPLSLKIHPLWNYNRNVVEKSLKDVGPWYDGIVEEQVRQRSDLLNPFKFFGNPILIVPNMISVYRDVKRFIDYPSIETYFATEYWVKS